MYKVEVYDIKCDRSIQWKIAPLDLAIRWFERWAEIFQIVDHEYTLNPAQIDNLKKGRQVRIDDRKRQIKLVIKRRPKNG